MLIYLGFLSPLFAHEQCLLFVTGTRLYPCFSATDAYGMPLRGVEATPPGTAGVKLLAEQTAPCRCQLPHVQQL